MTDSNLLLSKLFTETPTRFALLDCDFNFIRVNEAYANEHGHDVNFFPGRNYFDLYPSEARQVFEHVLETKESLRIKGRPAISLVQPEQGTTYWDWSLEPLLDRQFKVAGLIQAETEVTDRIRLQQAFDRSQKLLATITRAQEQHNPFSEPQDILTSMLNDLLDLTGSEHGFFDGLLHPEDDQPSDRLHVVAHVTWDDDTHEFYHSHAQQDLEFTNLHGLFGAVISSGEAVISNDAANDPRSGGVLKGHPALESFLGMPFSAGENVRGMIGVANRPDGYEKSVVEYLQPLLRSYAQLVQSAAINLQRQLEQASPEESDEWARDVVIPAVEDEHAELIEMINDIYQEMGRGGNIETVKLLLEKMYGAISDHFQHEEQLMESIGYPEYAAHMANHGKLLLTLRGHIDNFDHDPEHSAEIIQKTLAGWFGRHFSTLDFRLHKHLLN